jgi:DNA (cytosine-5)-methyltransferase 1
MRYVLKQHTSVTYNVLSPQVPDILAALEGLDNGDELSRHPILHGILQKGPSIPRAAINTRHLHRPSHPRVQKLQLAGNIDLAVLRRENQTATHVTPRIDSYARGLFQEQLCVVGPPPVRSRGPSPAQERDMRARLLRLLGNTLEDHRANIEIRRENRVNSGSFYVTEVKIDNEVFAVSFAYHSYQCLPNMLQLGDCVIVLIGQDGKHPAPKLPHDPRAIQHDKTLADFFWYPYFLYIILLYSPGGFRFAKIIHIDGEDRTMHVQWYEHSSKTAMGEICDPREVFLTEICDVLDLQCIVGKTTVHSYDFVSGSPPAMSHHDFYCKYVFSL